MTDGTRRHPEAMVRAAAACALLVALAALAGGCAPNDPFDPATVENIRPIAGMSVAPPDSGTFPVTSYYQRTFHWHGTDPDGWVVNFDMSMQVDPVVPAPWITTTRTDTTVTFATDDQGRAEATFFVVARDNRGALSDTVQVYFPLQNSPPEIYFDPDFEPNSNLQREFTAGGDTLYWNWGHGNFKFTASDGDGQDTMDDFFRYTFADTEPDSTYDRNDPRADPLTSWVRVRFAEAGDDPTSYGREFEITVFDLPAGDRTLTVSVRDEGDSDARFTYTWEVRDPRSNILYIGTSSIDLGAVNALDELNDELNAGGIDLELANVYAKVAEMLSDNAPGLAGVQANESIDSILAKRDRLQESSNVQEQ